MITTDKQFTTTDLVCALLEFANDHKILDNFYTITAHCDNEIRMQGYFKDELFDYLILNGFIFTYQRMLPEKDLYTALEQDILINNHIVKFVIVLIQKSK